MNVFIVSFFAALQFFLSSPLLPLYKCKHLKMSSAGKWPILLRHRGRSGTDFHVISDTITIPRLPAFQKSLSLMLHLLTCLVVTTVPANILVDMKMTVSLHELGRGTGPGLGWSVAARLAEDQGLIGCPAWPCPRTILFDFLSVAGLQYGCLMVCCRYSKNANLSLHLIHSERALYINGLFHFFIFRKGNQIRLNCTGCCTVCVCVCVCVF
jgi:hypothetical protein